MVNFPHLLNASLGPQCTPVPHTWLGWRHDLLQSCLRVNVIAGASSQKKYKSFKVDNRCKMIRPLMILMLGLFQADASIWFVRFWFVFWFSISGIYLWCVLSNHRNRPLSRSFDVSLSVDNLYEISLFADNLYGTSLFAEDLHIFFFFADY